jgi:ParB family transcriptional regulator, chromosome partitioning protein
MEEKQSPHQEIDVSRLALRYAHTRIARPKALNMIINSMDRYGQITPAIVAQEGDLIILIDGYLRVEALKRLGRDTIIAEICHEGELKALFRLLSRSGERQWEAVEQAWIILDIKTRFEHSLSQVARSIGHDLSWVSRRVSLIEGLSEDILKAVCQGHISTWAATRVLVPLERANPSHAEKLTAHLLDTPMSSRDLSAFLKHYEGSNKQTRDRMISDPDLFVKAHKSRDEKNLAVALDQGPEGQWIKDFRIVTSMLRRLAKIADTVIYPGQDEDDRIRLVRIFRDARSFMETIEEKIQKADGQ